MKEKAVFLFLLLSALFYSGFFDMGDIAEQQLWVILAAAAFFIGISHYNKIYGYGILYALGHLAVFQRPAYINSMTQILTLAIIYDHIARNYKSKNYILAFLFVLFLNVAMAFIQWSGKDVYVHINFQSPGMMTLPLYIGMYAAIVGPLLYAWNPWTVILCLLGIWFSKSSFSAIAFIAAMLFYFFVVGKRKIFKILLIFSMVGAIWFVGFYDAPSGQFSRRFHIWKMVGSAIAANPWGGFGLGSYNTHIRFGEVGNDSYRRYFTFLPSKPAQVAAVDEIIYDVSRRLYGEEKAKTLYTFRSLDGVKKWLRDNQADLYIWQHCHNEMLLAWFELGFPILIIIAFFLWDIFKRFLRYGHNFSILNDPAKFEITALMASTISVFIISQAHFPFCSPRISFPAIVILAILDQKLTSRKEKKDEI